MVMKVLKVVGVLLGSAIIGAMAGFIVAGLMLPADPTGRGAPGDGFLILLGMGFGVLISLVVAQIFVIRTIEGSTKAASSK